MGNPFSAMYISFWVASGPSFSGEIGSVYNAQKGLRCSFSAPPAMSSAISMMFFSVFKLQAVKTIGLTVLQAMASK